jgi:hypothetical protein
MSEFIDYDGPTGLYVATGERIVPLSTVEGTGALAYSAMLTVAGTGEKADVYEKAAQAALEQAHKLDEQAPAPAA